MYNKHFQALIFLAPTFAQCLLLIIVTKVPTFQEKSQQHGLEYIQKMTFLIKFKTPLGNT